MTSNEIEIVLSQFSETKIKSFVDEQGLTWHQGSHLCKVLEFSNPSLTIPANTEEDERALVDIGLKSPVWFVSEYGVWGLILASKSESAQKFKRWLKRDLLPKLKSQGYAFAKTDKATLASASAYIQHLEQENVQLVGDLNVTSLKLDEARATIARFKYGSSGWEKRMRQNNRLTSGVQVGC
jgi:prophage antirepressor-like protein